MRLSSGEVIGGGEISRLNDSYSGGRICADAAPIEDNALNNNLVGIWTFSEALYTDCLNTFPFRQRIWECNFKVICRKDNLFRLDILSASINLYSEDAIIPRLCLTLGLFSEQRVAKGPLFLSCHRFFTCPTAANRRNPLCTTARSINR